VRLALAAGTLVACYVFVLYRADTRLQLLKAQIDRDDPGWRLDDIEAARAQIPAAENSALVVIAACDLFPGSSLPVEVTNPFANLPANAPIATADYARLCNELSEWDAALAEARKLADMPRGRHRLVWTRPNLIASVLPTQQKSREVTTLLRFEALRRAEDGDVDGALADCRAMVNAGRSIGDEPIAISALIRSACVINACMTAERALAQGEPSPAELAALQRLLADEDAFPQLLVCMRGQRAWTEEVVTAVETGALSIGQLSLPGSTPRPVDRLMGSLLRPSYRSEHSSILTWLTRYVDSTRLPARDQLAALATIQAEVGSAPRTALLTHLLMPSMGKFSESCHRKHAHMRTLIAALTAERYRRAHGAWPASLTDLTPTELAAVPLDPFDDQPLRLLHLLDGIEIYSVGLDGIDDDGRLANGSQTNQPGFDIGIRLWDPQHRGRPAGEDHGERR
jgi:hypothetical protein